MHLLETCPGILPCKVAPQIPAGCVSAVAIALILAQNADRHLGAGAIRKTAQFREPAAALVAAVAFWLVRLIHPGA